MNRRRNIIFDIGGVLFDQSGDQEKLFVPRSEGISLLQECLSIPKHGHSFYVCTNLTIPYVELLHQEFPDIMGAFNGIVTPNTALAKKPSPKIYQYLINRYHLLPEDSIFIDDQEANILAAQEEGMIGIHAQDFNRVRTELKRIGVLS